MKKTFSLLMASILVAGCAGGPPKDYYNPILPDPPHFSGGLSMEAVDDYEATVKQLKSEGYTLIGTSVYAGSQPKAIELKAQARRVNATKVVYNVSVPAAGTWEVHVGLMNGGHGGGSIVKIAYLGK